MDEPQRRKRAALGKISNLVALIAIGLAVVAMIMFAAIADNPNATFDQKQKLHDFSNIAAVAVPAAHAGGMFIALAGLLFESRGRFWAWLGMILNFGLLSLYLVFYLLLNELASGN
jgi:hypothetical protein